MSGIQQAAQNQSGPLDVLRSRADDFTRALPTTVNPDVWLRMAEHVIARDQKLLQAASNDLGEMSKALLECAYLGHTLGSDSYYLIPRKSKGVFKVSGQESYKGLIQRILRTGLVQKVIAEVVCEQDAFEFDPQVDDRPKHTFDLSAKSRGKPIMSYAFVQYKDGTTSAVAVATAEDIAKSRSMSQGADSNYSPWNTAAHAMYKKTAIHKLEPYVETSTEDHRIAQQFGKKDN